MATDGPIPVTTAADIRDAHADIDGRAVAVIRERLQTDAQGSEAVGWVAAWLLEEDDKPLETAEGHDQVFVGRVERSTDKAWQIAQSWTDAEPVWLPKSQSVLFERAAGVDDISSEQATLEDLS